MMQLIWNVRHTFKKRVAVWGTFDLLHDGHLAFLENVSKLGEIHVIVIPDEQILLNKGYLPDNDTVTRKTNLEKLRFVKKAYIDCMDMGLTSIDTIQPHYFCLGYDQDIFWEETLKREFEKRGQNPKFRRCGQYANGIHSKMLRKGRQAA